MVGEDLGTVEDYVRTELSAHSVLSYKLIQFEPVAAALRPPTTTAGVASRTASNDAYDRASIQLKALQSDLETMKAAKRYAATAGCTNATAEASIALCGQVAAKEAELAQARATLALGRPGSPDAQADAIAEILPAGISASQVSAKMPALLGITTELAAILFFFCSVPPGSRRIVEVEPIVLSMSPEAKPETPALEAPTPPAARQIAAPKKTATTW